MHREPKPQLALLLQNGEVGAEASLSQANWWQLLKEQSFGFLFQEWIMIRHTRSDSAEMLSRED
jgi:hypothetical protein